MNLSISLNPNTSDVVAIVVTYNPQPDQLKRLLEATLPQVKRILIIDNGSNPASLDLIGCFFQNLPIDLHSLGVNQGIAKAQNIGIQLAKKMGAKYVLLFDHDSLPAPDMVAKLLTAIQIKHQQGVRVGAVGPWYEDIRGANLKSTPFVENKGLRLIRKKKNQSDLNNMVSVSHLIASGSLIPMATLNLVGDMREDLFIDLVDIEWGLRAQQLGYSLFGVCDGLMEHDLGENPQVIFGKELFFHSPLRHYYQVRNSIWLYQQPHLPLLWKIGDAGRLFVRISIFVLFAKPQLQHWKMMVKGVFHGVIGRVGKL